MRVSGSVLPGAVGGLCCVVGVVAVGPGLAGSGFEAPSTVRCQLCARAAGLVAVARWLPRTVRATRPAGLGRGGAAVGAALLRTSVVPGLVVGG